MTIFSFVKQLTLLHNAENTCFLVKFYFYLSFGRVAEFYHPGTVSQFKTPTSKFSPPFLKFNLTFQGQKCFGNLVSNRVQKATKEGE